MLGSAAGGGFPQWNCRCRVCSLAWERDPRVKPRTQSSLAASGDGESWILFNASPDLRVQIGATPELWPGRAVRHSPIVGVILTNADVDHVAGLLSLRERQPLQVVALEPVHAALAGNSIFEVLAPDVVERVVAKAGETIRFGALELELFAVPGKAPLYLEGAEPEIGSEAGETTGVIVRSTNSALAYIPGCASVTPKLLERMEEADTLLFDGTVFSDDEMISAGVGSKTGRRMGHVPISGAGGSLEALHAVDGIRKIYIHINNTNPILVEDSPERRAVEEAGFEVAYDGMEIPL